MMAMCICCCFSWLLVLRARTFIRSLMCVFVEFLFLNLQLHPAPRLSLYDFHDFAHIYAGRSIVLPSNWIGLSAFHKRSPAWLYCFKRSTRRVFTSLTNNVDRTKWKNEWVKPKTSQNTKLSTIQRCVCASVLLCKCVCVCSGKGGRLLALTSLIKQEISIIEFVLCFCFCMTTFPVYLCCSSFFSRWTLLCASTAHIECVCFLPIQSLNFFSVSVFSSFTCCTIIINIMMIIVILPKNVWHQECVCIRSLFFWFFPQLRSSFSCANSASNRIWCR